MVAATNIKPNDITLFMHVITNVGKHSCNEMTFCSRNIQKMRCHKKPCIGSFFIRLHRNNHLISNLVETFKWGKFV